MTPEQMQAKAARLYDEAARTTDLDRKAELDAEADALMDMIEEGEEYDEGQEEARGSFYEREFDADAEEEDDVSY